MQQQFIKGTVSQFLLFCKSMSAHLSLLHGHGLASGRRLLVDAGQEVLGDPQGVLQKRVVRVAGGRVFEQVLEYSSGWRNINLQKCPGKRAHSQMHVHRHATKVSSHSKSTRAEISAYRLLLCHRPWILTANGKLWHKNATYLISFIIIR